MCHHGYPHTRRRRALAWLDRPCWLLPVRLRRRALRKGVRATEGPVGHHRLKRHAIMMGSFGHPLPAVDRALAEARGPFPMAGAATCETGTLGARHPSWAQMKKAAKSRHPEPCTKGVPTTRRLALVLLSAVFGANGASCLNFCPAAISLIDSGPAIVTRSALGQGTISLGTRLTSPNGNFVAIFGNCTVTVIGTTIDPIFGTAYFWRSNQTPANSQAICPIVFDASGTLKISPPLALHAGPGWSSTGGLGGTILLMQDDGFLAILNSDCTPARELGCTEGICSPEAMCSPASPLFCGDDTSTVDACRTAMPTINPIGLPGCGLDSCDAFEPTLFTTEDRDVTETTVGAADLA